MTNLVKFAPSAPNQFEVEISFYLILNGVCYKACIDKKQIKQNTTNLSIWKCIRKYNIKGTSVSCVELNSYWLISISSRLLTPPTLSMNIRLLLSLQDIRLVVPKSLLPTKYRKSLDQKQNIHQKFCIWEPVVWDRGAWLENYNTVHTLTISCHTIVYISADLLISVFVFVVALLFLQLQILFCLIISRWSFNSKVEFDEPSLWQKIT